MPLSWSSGKQLALVFISEVRAIVEVFLRLLRFLRAHVRRLLAHSAIELQGKPHSRRVPLPEISAQIIAQKA